MEEDFNSMMRPFLSIIEKTVKKSVQEALSEQTGALSEAISAKVSEHQLEGEEDSKEDLYLGFATAYQIIKRSDPRLYEGSDAPFKSKYDICRFCKANSDVFIGKPRSKNQTATAICIHNALIRQNERDIAQGKKIKFNVKRK